MEDNIVAVVGLLAVAGIAAYFMLNNSDAVGGSPTPGPTTSPTIPTQCEMSPWSAWSGCSATSGSCGMGTRSRSRTIVKQGREACPPTTETVACEVQCYSLNHTTTTLRAKSPEQIQFVRSSWTLSVWFKLVGFSSTSSVVLIKNNMLHGEEHHSYYGNIGDYVGINVYGGQISAYIGALTSSNNRMSYLTQPPPTEDIVNKWMHVALVCDRQSNNKLKVSMHINGSLVDEKLVDDIFSRGMGSLEVGNVSSSPATGSPLNGYLKDLAFYNVALSTMQVRGIYNNGDPLNLKDFSDVLPYLQCYYRFNYSMNDSTQNARNLLRVEGMEEYVLDVPKPTDPTPAPRGTCVMSAWSEWSSCHAVGAACSTSGVRSRRRSVVTAGPDCPPTEESQVCTHSLQCHSLNMGGEFRAEFNGFPIMRNEGAITFWFKLREKPTFQRSIFELNDASGNAFIWIYVIRSKDDKPWDSISFLHKTRSGRVFLSSLTSQSLDTGRWYHIALSYKADEYIGYLNGSRSSTFSRPPETPISLPTTGKVVVGATSSYGNNYQAPNALMKDLAIYNTALSADQISKIYNSGQYPDLMTLSDISQNLEAYYRFNNNLISSAGLQKTMVRVAGQEFFSQDYPTL